MQQLHRRGSPDISAMEQRSSARFGIALPVTMEGGEGETHDISETGILFETECEPQIGARIGMTLRYSIDGKDYQLGCEVEVVRVERIGAKVNVAGRLLSPLFSAQ